jgi:predicted phage tail protein
MKPPGPIERYCTLSDCWRCGVRVTGWTGAGCSGLGPCAVRASTDQTVTATFGKPKGTKITKAKLTGKKRKKLKLSFNTPGAVTGYQCQLTKPAKRRKAAGKSAKKGAKKPKFTKCASGKTYKKLKPGKYTFKVRALNILGAEAKPARKTIRVKASKKKAAKR